MQNQDARLIITKHWQLVGTESNTQASFGFRGVGRGLRNAEQFQAALIGKRGIVQGGDFWLFALWRPYEPFN
jgi:hypothetical protein